MMGILKLAIKRLLKKSFNLLHNLSYRYKS